MSTKLRATTRYLLIDQLKMLGEAAVTVFVLFIGFPLLFSLVSGNISSFSLLNSLANFSRGFLLALFIFIYNSLTYDNFKLLIQNGISRKTFWGAKVLTIICIAAIGELFSAFYRYAISVPILGISTHAALMSTPYSLYANFLGANVWVNILGSLLFNLIFMIGVGVTGMAIGGALALFSKWVQRILIIVIPVLGLFLLGFVASTASGHTDYDYSGWENFLKFLVGYPQHDPATTGLFNPTAPMITMLIGCVIMAAIAYGVNQLLKIKD